MKVYFDESGIGGTQARFMTVGLLYNPHPDCPKHVREVFTRARKHWLKKDLRYLSVFKAAQTDPSVRTRILSRLATIPGMVFVPATIEKQGDWRLIQRLAYSLLTTACSSMIGQLSGSRDIQIIWKPGPNKLNPTIFREYFAIMSGSLQLSEDPTLKHAKITAVACELHQDVLLQAVDFFTNCAWRASERDHQSDWALIKPIATRALRVSITEEPQEKK